MSDSLERSSHESAVGESPSHRVSAALMLQIFLPLTPRGDCKERGALASPCLCAPHAISTHSPFLANGGAATAASPGTPPGKPGTAQQRHSSSRTSSGATACKRAAVSQTPAGRETVSLATRRSILIHQCLIRDTVVARARRRRWQRAEEARSTHPHPFSKGGPSGWCGRRELRRRWHESRARQARCDPAWKRIGLRCDAWVVRD